VVSVHRDGICSASRKQPLVLAPPNPYTRYAEQVVRYRNLDERDKYCLSVSSIMNHSTGLKSNHRGKQWRHQRSWCCHPCLSCSEQNSYGTSKRPPTRTRIKRPEILWQTQVNRKSEVQPDIATNSPACRSGILNMKSCAPVSNSSEFLHKQVHSESQKRQRGAPHF